MLSHIKRFQKPVTLLKKKACVLKVESRNNKKHRYTFELLLCVVGAGIPFGSFEQKLPNLKRLKCSVSMIFRQGSWNLKTLKKKFKREMMNPPSLSFLSLSLPLSLYIRIDRLSLQLR